MYNFRNNLDATLDIRAPDSNRLRSDLPGYPGGQPALSDRWNDTGAINTGTMQETNPAIRATVQTRTRDQRQINQHQLAFMYTKNYDKPVMLSLPQLNQILAGGDPVDSVAQKSLYYSNGVQRQGSKYDMNNPKMWSKEYIKQHFKLFGAIVNRDTDLRDDMPMERIARAFTMTVRGDCHVLDYWSRNGNALRRYDLCYFVMKKVWLKANTSYQTNLTARIHDTGHKTVKKSGYYWQVLPVNVKDRSIQPDHYTSCVWYKPNPNGRIDPATGKPSMVEAEDPSSLSAQQKKDYVCKHVIGTYWRVGFTHEEASIGNAAMYEKRKPDSVSRDVSYLTDNGAVRPMQFYLWLDDDTKLV